MPFNSLDKLHKVQTLIFIHKWSGIKCLGTLGIDGAKEAAISSLLSFDVMSTYMMKMVMVKRVKEKQQHFPCASAFSLLWIFSPPHLLHKRQQQKQQPMRGSSRANSTPTPQVITIGSSNLKTCCKRQIQVKNSLFYEKKLFELAVNGTNKEGKISAQISIIWEKLVQDTNHKSI